MELLTVTMAVTSASVVSEQSYETLSNAISDDTKLVKSRQHCTAPHLWCNATSTCLNYTVLCDGNLDCVDKDGSVYDEDVQCEIAER